MLLSRRSILPPTLATAACLCMLLRSASADAYCRAVTASPPAGYNPATSGGCFGDATDGGNADGGLYPLFWRAQCVSYSFQQVPSKYVTLNQASTVAAQAFGAWMNAECDGAPATITAVEYPTVSCDAVPSQGSSNVILFRDDAWPYDDSANAIGYTTLTVQLGTGEIIGADIEINSANYMIVPEPPAPAMAYDLASILTHEAGHFFGLAHSANSSAVMYAYYQPGTTTLTADDVAGICSIYNADFSRNTSVGPIASYNCDATPPLGFLRTGCGSIDGGLSTLSAIGSGGGTNSSIQEAEETCSYPGGCSIVRCSAGVAGFAPWALVVLGLVLRRAKGPRRRWRRMHPARLAVLVTLAGVLVARPAGASVSVAALFEGLLEEASAAAVVTPTEQLSVWEERRIVTYTHVRVDRIAAGHIAGEVWVRTLGGAVGDIAQIAEGNAAFAIGRPSLVFLRPHVETGTQAHSGSFIVVERAQGQFPIDAREDGAARLALASDLGAIVAPSAESVAQVARGLPGGPPPRLARDVLAGRLLEDAAGEIARTWARVHGT
jgi:uncharacterized protein (TIGR03382 family)